MRLPQVPVSLLELAQQRLDAKSIECVALRARIREVEAERDAAIFQRDALNGALSVVQQERDAARALAAHEPDTGDEQ